MAVPAGVEELLRRACSPAGEVPSDGAVVHVSTLRDGLVERMDVEPAG